MKNSKIQIVICGGNGFTGRFLCEELLKHNNINFIVVLRPGTNTFWMDKKNISFKFADLNKVDQLKNAIKGSDILISVASIAFGNASSIIEACKKLNIKRVIFTSSTSIFTKLNAKSKKIRINAEEVIYKSELDWTIIRPTMIYGTPEDRNIIKLIKWIDKYPLLPIFGNGNYLQQPIFVKDVAKSIIKVIQNKRSFRKSFNIAGFNPITYNQMIKLIKIELQTNCKSIFLPASFVITIFKILEKLKIKMPIKAEQIERLNEHKFFSNEEAEKIFNFNPIDFKAGIKIEVEKYKNNLIF